MVEKQYLTFFIHIYSFLLLSNSIIFLFLKSLLVSLSLNDRYQHFFCVCRERESFLGSQVRTLRTQGTQPRKSNTEFGKRERNSEKVDETAHHNEEKSSKE